MHWFSTALLIALTAGTAAWTSWLLRRLFVVEPASAGSTDERSTEGPNAEEPNA